MTSAHPMVQRPGDDADARFAAYLADVAAHIDDPHHGEEYRAILDEDPETQRARFDVVEDMSAAPIGNPAALTVSLSSSPGQTSCAPAMVTAPPGAAGTSTRIAWLTAVILTGGST